MWTYTEDNYDGILRYPLSDEGLADPPNDIELDELPGPDDLPDSDRAELAALARCECGECETGVAASTTAPALATRSPNSELELYGWPPAAPVERTLSPTWRNEVPSAWLPNGERAW